MSNIVYSSKELSDYYAAHRNSWACIYESEKKAFLHAAKDKGTLGRVLDVGCGAGGLCLALGEQQLLTGYTGVDIHSGAIDFARTVKNYAVNSHFIAADILQTELPASHYDTVISLGCADWNIETTAIIERCWNYVAPGGNLIITLRLTNKQTIKNFNESFQYIYFAKAIPHSTEGLEKAPYVVINTRETFALLTELTPCPQEIYAYGYWGTPSLSAVTPFERIVFAAFAIKKPTIDNQMTSSRTEFHLPIDIFYYA